jgi:hypothetical protein
MAYRGLVETLNEKDILEDLDIDGGRTVIKLTLLK